jgi:hypothetical protein
MRPRRREYTDRCDARVQRPVVEHIAADRQRHPHTSVAASAHVRLDEEHGGRSHGLELVAFHQVGACAGAEQRGDRALGRARRAP